MAISDREVKKQGKVQTRKIKKKILENHKCTQQILSNAINT